MSISPEVYGPTALVTGASAGLGLEYSKELARKGFSLVLVARRKDRLEALAEECRELGSPRIDVFPLDLTEKASCSFLTNQIMEKKIPLGLLINNAGFGKYEAFFESSLSEQLQLLDLNARVPLELTHRLLPILKSRPRSGVIILSSIVAHLPSPYFANYSATKGWDLLFAEGLYHELRPYRVDVLAVLPGLTTTEFHDVAGIRKDKIPFPFRKAPQVVQTSFRALGKKAAVIDGKRNKIMVFLARFLPRSWVGLLNAKVLKR
ncbi:MAG: SDR family oxidoreductase [Bradymonadales bacterium]|nr:MAG: SDR family oxidoreductase [Bradymonadales bacterium]